ncbi:MAG: hypothetical protein IJZ89_00625 [Clostridia bacterium]|nr:hypothetical protein [Clostridia bacterium]
MHTKEQIMNVLKRSYEDSRYILMGEQLMGGMDMPNDMFARYRKATGGKLPAVLGIDLACYGLDLQKVGEGSKKWNEMLDQITDFAEQGGIVTASSHFANPIPDPEARALCRGVFGGADKWDEMLTEGTELNKIIKDELILDGKFLKALGERGVTVLWRPLHEANGGWFWFCARSTKKMDWLDGEYLRRFWRYIYKLYTDEMKLDNLVWIYSPNVSANSSNGTRDVLYYYPGDEYCDMVGVDWYTSNKMELNNPGHSYDKIMSLGKIAVLAELGPRPPLREYELDSDKQAKLFSAVDLIDMIKDQIRRGCKIAYALTWHYGRSSICSLGRADEAMADPFCVDLEKLGTLYE